MGRKESWAIDYFQDSFSVEGRRVAEVTRTTTLSDAGSIAVVENAGWSEAIPDQDRQYMKQLLALLRTNSKEAHELYNELVNFSAGTYRTTDLTSPEDLLL